MKRNKIRPQEVSSTSDNDGPASDSEMLEPIDSFTVDLFGASVPSQSMTLQARSDPVRRVVTNKLPSTSTQSSNIRTERHGEQDRSSPQQPPQSATSPYVNHITYSHLNLNENVCSITSFSKPFPSPKKNATAYQEPITLVKQPQLDLQPLYEVGFARPKTKTKTAVASAARIHNPNPPTSPIEEIVEVIPPAALENQVKNKTSMAQTSDLYLEVKERIAKHSSIKQRDKLLKRGSSKMTAPIDESSIIYVSSSPSSRATSPISAAKSAFTVTSKQGQKKTKQPADKRKGKEKPQPMTPTEYARSLNEKLAAASDAAVDSSTSKPKKRRPVKFLEGKYIFYTGGDMKHASEMTRGRMDLVGFLSSFFLASSYVFNFRL